jgi:hypothetical protein
MRSRSVSAPLAAGMMALANHAHGFAGGPKFISTLLIDGPNVADGASLSMFSFLPRSGDDGAARGLHAVGFACDKRITENFGFALDSGCNRLRQPGAKTANGRDNLSTTLKFKPYVTAEHELMLSVGGPHRPGKPIVERV